MLNAQSLPADKLIVLIAGPGVGELIMMRPPGSNGWLIIDGCAHVTDSMASFVLEETGGYARGVILTHPHEDHYFGIAQLLDVDSGSNMPELVGLVEKFMPSNRPESDGDAQVRSGHGGREHVLNAILTWWRTYPSSKWDARSGSSRTLGNLHIRALHPSQADVTAWKGKKPNDLALAIEVRCGSAVIILGSDLEQPHWDNIHLASAIQAPTLLKIPHHGSTGSGGKASSWNGKAPDPFRTSTWGTGAWCITPYSRSGIPHLSSGGGIDILLRHHDELCLSALPRRSSLNIGAPCRVNRTQLHGSIVSSKIAGSVSATTIPPHTAISNQWTHVVAAIIDPDSSSFTMEYGSGTYVVSR